MALLAVAVLGHGIVDPSTPIITADDLGLTRGDGCFEGLRVRRVADSSRSQRSTGHAEAVDLDGHLGRMARSAAELGIAFDEDAWRGLVATLADAWAGNFRHAGEAAMKLVLTRGRAGGNQPAGFATISDSPDDTAARRRDGIDVITLSRGTTDDSYAGAPWLLGGVKTLSYAVNMAAQREATARGAHEAIFVTSDGSLLEAPTSSVVWASANTLSTVADGEGNGILHSITVESLFRRAAEEGWATLSTHGQIADLLDAEVAMLVSSGFGPLRIRSLDGKRLPPTAAGLRILAACRRLTHFPQG